MQVFCKFFSKTVCKLTKTHNKTIKKKLNKCKTIFHAYNDRQFRYGEVLDKREDILEIRCNVKLDGLY